MLEMTVDEVELWMVGDRRWDRIRGGGALSGETLGMMGEGTLCVMAVRWGEVL